MEDFGFCRRRHLPHWDLPGATYFITTCLAGSIPAEGLLDLARYRVALATKGDKSNVSTEEQGIRQWKKAFARHDWWLDLKPAIRHFAEPSLASIVVDACYFWVGRRYDLLAYVVMPSHLHWVFRPFVGQVGNSVGQVGNSVGQVGNSVGQVGNSVGQVGNLSYGRSPRERIMHTLKRHTARECNRRLGCAGVFWQEESYDHCVRDDDELERIIQYVEFNPVKAGLVARPEEWGFSSAHDRGQYGLLPGQPLVRKT